MVKTLALSLLVFALTSQAQAAKAKDDYPYMNFSSTSMTASPGEAHAKKKKKEKKKKLSDVPTAKAAESELVLEPKDLTNHLVATPATVVSSIEPVSNPIRKPSFEIGASLQQYQPRGSIKLPGFQAYNLGSVGSMPMVGLDFRWMPLKFNYAQPLSSGLYISGAYAQADMNVTTPSGMRIENTRLQTISGEFGSATSWSPSDLSKWSGRLQLGFGQFTSVQTSASSYINHSAAEIFWSAGAFAEYNVFERVSLFLGYDYRAPLHGEPDEIILQRSNIMAGLTGGFN